MKTRKILATLLSLAMVIGLMTPAAMAEEETSTIDVIKVNAPIEITGNTTLEGKTYERAEGYTGTFFNVADGVTLSLKDCTVDGGAVWSLNEDALASALETISEGGNASKGVNNYITVGEGNVDSTASLIVLNGAANLTVTDTTIKNFYTANTNHQVIKAGDGENTVTLDSAVVTGVVGYSSAAILGLSSNDTLTITESTKIHGNIGENPGALISICGTEATADETTLKVLNGEFYNNVSVNGSMMMIRRSTGTIAGGKFHDNYALYTGNNSNCVPVYVHDYSAFTMSGGEISNNYTYFGGAIVAMANSEIKLEGGTLGKAMEGSVTTGSIAANTSVETGKNMTISEGAYVLSDLKNNGTITGDIYAAALENSGIITGDVYANGNVTNSGTIDGGVQLNDENAEIINTGTITKAITAGDGSSIVAMIGTARYDDLRKAMVAAKSGETVKLLANVDLAGTEWEPVSFKGNFDGQGYTISNLTIDKPGVSYTGFITSLNGTFENVTFTNPTVTGGECTGVVAGRAGGGAALAKNITVNGTIKVETTHSGYARAAVIVGGWAYGKYQNITVDGTDAAKSYVKHTGGGDGRYVAGIVGHADDVDEYTNCTVKNITISGGWLCGGIAGPGPANGGTVSGCAVENVKMHADYSGGMFGWYFGNGTIADSSVKNVEFTDGSTCNGAIGGYAMNEDATVTNVTIENVANANGAPLAVSYAATVTSGGNTVYYADLETALKALESGDTLTLLSDVTITAAWDCRSNGARITVPVTIDGNGHKLTINGEISDMNWNTVFRFEDNATVKNLTIDVSGATGVQRGISAKLGITMDNCTLIGNGTAKRAVIFGEGAGSAISDVVVSIKDCTFTNWSYGVSDNQNAQDAKSVTITESNFNNASVLVSAFDSVTFTDNVMDNSWANITSYTKSKTLKVDATGNTLEANNETKENKISATLEANITADPGFNIVLEDEHNTKYYEVTLSVPAGATVEVKDAAGVICEPASGIYALQNGNYTYTVSKSGYYSKSGEFTVADDVVELSITLSPKSSGGSSSSSGSYAVTTEKAENGSIKVSPSRADAGDTVTITVTPDKGYELDTLTVTDKNGDEVKVTKKNGKYTFEMPKGKVTVEATFAEVEEELPFTDVADDFWAVDEIVWAYEEGLMNGNSATTFNPNGLVTRQQVWMILARMAGYAPEDMAAAKGWAMSTGVSDGSTPGSPVTRQQLVTLIWRAEGEPEGDLSVLAGYPDAASVADYAKEAMAWAIENGVIGGTAQGTLNPAGNANRAQLAVILYRYVG